MPFWSENFGDEGRDLKDPKRQFRFKVEFTGINAAPGGSVMWYAKSATKPSFSVNSAEHVYLNHKFYYPGAVTWNEVSVVLVDPRDPDVAATLSDIVELSGYKPPTDPFSLGTMSKQKAAGALGTVFITQIDGDGAEIEKWSLHNAFISDLKYGDLAYGNDDLVELTVQMKYDWAELDSVEGRSAHATGTQKSRFFFQ